MPVSLALVSEPVSLAAVSLAADSLVLVSELVELDVVVDPDSDSECDTEVDSETESDSEAD
ncbi:hypothetical protein HO928_00910 [Streptococcus suis]|nr:hypothetical protein [Streptococcus suis]NQP18343.1 hypothetical protein [Streptococcus suis]